MNDSIYWVEVNWNQHWVRLRRYDDRVTADRAVVGWKRQHNCVGDGAFRVSVEAKGQDTPLLVVNPNRP